MSTPAPIVAILDDCFGRLIPDRLDSPRARQQLVAISGQEADLRHRWQVVDLKRPQVMGPARGLWQFEQGTRVSRGGVWGVYLHAASAPLVRHACAVEGIAFDPVAIYRALPTRDAFACAIARALLYTDPRPLPNIGEVWPAWDYYSRNWRPGKPHPEDWPNNYSRARRILSGGME